MNQMSRDGVRTVECWAACVYTALVEENPPRSRSGSRGTAGFSKGGRPLDVSSLLRANSVGGAGVHFSCATVAVADEPGYKHR
jgi:hypothetical protein